MKPTKKIKAWAVVNRKAIYQDNEWICIFSTKGRASDWLGDEPGKVVPVEITLLTPKKANHPFK